MILLARKNLLIILAVIIIFCALGFFVIHQMTTTYNAHNTFDGYCKWRGLVVVNKFSDYGYCQDLRTGKEFKIVLYNGRWFLDGDLPCGFLCF